MLLVGVCAVAAMAIRGQASVVILRSGNTIAAIDPASATVDSLTVGGFSQIVQQSLWYRIGQTGPQLPLSSLTQTSSASIGSSLFLGYTGPGFTVRITYSIQGGSNPTSAGQLDNLIFFSGTSATPLDLHVFQYDHLKLDNLGNGTVSVNTATNQVIQKNTPHSGTSAIVSPALNTSPAATSEYRVAASPAIFNSITSGEPITLNDSAGPAGPGDVEFALESDTSLRNLGVFPVVTTDTFNPGVPLPEAVWMGLSTLAAIGAVAIVRRGLRPA
jgi:hypothetical protein